MAHHPRPLAVWKDVILKLHQKWSSTRDFQWAEFALFSSLAKTNQRCIKLIKSNNIFQCTSYMNGCLFKNTIPWLLQASSQSQSQRKFLRIQIAIHIDNIKSLKRGGLFMAVNAVVKIFRFFFFVAPCPLRTCMPPIRYILGYSMVFLTLFLSICPVRVKYTKPSFPIMCPREVRGQVSFLSPFSIDLLHVPPKIYSQHPSVGFTKISFLHGVALRPWTIVLKFRICLTLSKR